MPRRSIHDISYTGKALKIYEKVAKKEEELKTLKEELRIAYKEQLKAEKSIARAEEKAKRAELIKAIAKSGKDIDEILAAIKD